MLLLNVTRTTAKNSQFFSHALYAEIFKLIPLSMSYNMHFKLYMKIAPVIFGILVLTPTMIGKTWILEHKVMFLPWFYRFKAFQFSTPVVFIIFHRKQFVHFKGGVAMGILKSIENHAEHFTKHKFSYTMLNA